MLKLLSGLLNLHAAVSQKLEATQVYGEAIALYNAGEHRKAFPLMTNAAELGHPEAMSILGSMYLLGQGVKENGKLAIEWLNKAIDAGFDAAKSVLGMALATGKAGVKVDIDKARELLSDAAANGDQQSAQMLTMIDNGEGMFRSLKRKKR